MLASRAFASRPLTLAIGRLGSVTKPALEGRKLEARGFNVVPRSWSRISGARGLCAAVTGGDLETKIKEQGDKVRDLKAAKASKDDITAAVQVLLGLKAEAEKAAAPAQPEERVIADAPVRVSDFGPLALAEGRVKVHEIMGSSGDMVGKEVLVKGWCRTVRDQKAFSFIELNDGSLPKGIQIVAQSSMDTYAEVQKLTTGAALAVRGTIVESQGKGQKYEIQATQIQLVGDCSGMSTRFRKRSTRSNSCAPSPICAPAPTPSGRSLACGRHSRRPRTPSSKSRVSSTCRLLSSPPPTARGQGRCSE